MRAEDDVYWSTSLPKNHEALQALDAFCNDWGGLTRAEATRRILIEWDKLCRGKEVSAWAPNASPLLTQPGPSEGSRRVPGGTQKGLLSNSAAKAASQVLDE
jgi:hypothetical protein